MNRSQILKAMLVGLGLLVLFGFILVLIPSSPKPVGYLFLGVSVVVGLVWGTASFVSWLGTNSKPTGDSIEVTPEILTGKWDSVASDSTFKYEGPNCDSTALYTPTKDGIEVQNVCIDVISGKTKTATGLAQVTPFPGSLSVSFFPGIQGSYVVRQMNQNVLVKS